MTAPKLSQSAGQSRDRAVPHLKPPGTVKSEAVQDFNPTVPLSHPLRARDAGQWAAKCPAYWDSAGQSPFANGLIS